MTDIDQAFRKAYAKRVPGEELDVQQETPAVWIDENSGRAFRNDVEHGIAAPHGKASGEKANSGVTESRVDQAHDSSNPKPIESPVESEEDSGTESELTTASETNITHDNPEPVNIVPEVSVSSSLDVRPGTTAYDAWKEKLKDFESRKSEVLPTPKMTPPKYSPVWEVDQVALPSISEQLVNEYLSGIGGQLERACREGLQTLAICSQQRGTGRSTVSIAIAQTAAKSGLRVALVDGDVDNPTLVDKLQLDMDIDWIDAIAQGFSVEEATVQSIDNGFSFLPLLPKPNETLNKVDQYAKLLFERLKHHFDLIVVDNSPLCYGSFGHAIPITADMYDAVMMVEDMKSGDTDSLEACARRIRAVGIDNIGLIENFSQVIA